MLYQDQHRPKGYGFRDDGNRVRQVFNTRSVARIKSLLEFLSGSQRGRDSSGIMAH